MIPAVGENQIGHAVAIDVRQQHGRRSAARGIAGMLPEGAGSSRQPDRHRVVPGGGGHHGQVRQAIVVAIAGPEPGRSGAKVHHALLLEMSAGLAEQDRQRVVATIGNGQIGLAVAIVVSHGQSGGLSSGGIIDRRAKRAVSAARQQIYAIVARGGNRQIRYPVAVEISRGDRGRLPADRHNLAAYERPVGAAQENHNAVVRAVENRQIGLAVPVPVADGRRSRRVPRVQRVHLAEAAIAGAGQHEDLLARREDDIGLAVTVQIARHHPGGRTFESRHRPARKMRGAAGHHQQLLPGGSGARVKKVPRIYGVQGVLAGGEQHCSQAGLSGCVELRAAQHRRAIQKFNRSPRMQRGAAGGHRRCQGNCIPQTRERRGGQVYG